MIPYVAETAIPRRFRFRFGRSRGIIFPPLMYLPKLLLDIAVWLCYNNQALENSADIAE